MSFRKENELWYEPVDERLVEEAQRAAIDAFRKALDPNYKWADYLPYSGEKCTDWH